MGGGLCDYRVSSLALSMGIPPWCIIYYGDPQSQDFWNKISLLLQNLGEPPYEKKLLLNEYLGDFMHFEKIPLNFKPPLQFDIFLFLWINCIDTNIDKLQQQSFDTKTVC